jgi:hypothetical protein
MAKKETQAGKSAARNVQKKVKRQRSPNNPTMSLKTAVEKLPGLFEAMKRHAVGVEVAVRAMEYSFTSSTGKLALASMRAFGLFETVTKGSHATVKLSTRALDIATDYPRESADWWKAVKKAALEPSVHSQLWEKYGPSLPADDELRRFLVRELAFNDNAVGTFIQEYKDTISFAKLDESDIIDENGDGEEDGENGEKTRRREDHQKGRIKRKREMSSGLKEDVFSLDEGEVILQWPDRLSKTSAEDLQDWLELIGRKIKRAVDAPAPDAPSDGAED